MNEFDARLKMMAGAEVCPVPEGFEGRIGKQLEELNEAKVRKLRPARWALAAACLCVVLVGTAFAVEAVTGISILRYFSAEEYDKIMQSVDPNYRSGEEQYIGIVLPSEEMGVSLDGISKEALTFARKHEAAGDAADKEFSSLEEMEAFLGLDFYDNPVMDDLAQETYSGPELYDDDRPVSVEREHGVYLLCCPDGEGMAWIQTTHFVSKWDGTLSAVVGMEAVSARITSQSGESTVLHPEGTQLTEECFSAAWGEPVSIVRCDYSVTELSEAHTAFMSYFFVNGIRYSVIVEAGQFPEQGMELMKEILDAFVFKSVS